MIFVCTSRGGFKVQSALQTSGSFLAGALSLGVFLFWINSGTDPRHEPVFLPFCCPPLCPFLTGCPFLCGFLSLSPPMIQIFAFLFFNFYTNLIYTNFTKSKLLSKIVRVPKTKANKTNTIQLSHYKYHILTYCTQLNTI